jgi:uncharacterized protein YecE (DUF72 family)
VTIRVGTSGWSYDHWAGVLYPEGLPSSRRRDLYASRFSTVELNASFYRWPRDASFARWRSLLPDGFRMSVKAPRGLTHAKRLFEPEGWVAKMTAAWHELGDKRGVLLLQLPPTLERDDARLDFFLACLPAWIRVAVELRHPSWYQEDVFRLLERRNAVYCVMSGANLPCVLRATSDIVYVRLHGPDLDHLYGGSYSDSDLRWWSERAREWNAAANDVYLYFNNDGDGNAVRNADRLRQILEADGVAVL